MRTVRNRLGFTMMGIAGGIVVILALAYFWLANNSHIKPIALPGAEVKRPAVRPMTNTPGMPSSAVAGDKSAPTEAADYRALFKASTDYWTLAHSILLPAARAGNADAQFYLPQALEKCAGANSLLFERRGKTLSLQEATQQAVAIGRPASYVQSIYDRCHNFLNRDASDLGSAASWLAAATDAQQPSAQATTASKILMHDLMQRTADAAGVDNPNSDNSTISASSPRELLREAISTGDPVALFLVGDSQPLLEPAAMNSNINRYAWMLLACQAGFDCSPSADWVVAGCTGSQATQCASAASPDDLIHILSADQWPQVQQRAQELSSALNAKDWNALGLGE
jgi:hypothetical protein